MKARHIRIIRQKLSDKIFLLDQIEKWAQKEKELDKFFRFECSEFFEGKTLAELNKKIYEKKSKICWAKLRKFKKLYGFDE